LCSVRGRNADGLLDWSVEGMSPGVLPPVLRTVAFTGPLLASISPFLSASHPDHLPLVSEDEEVIRSDSVKITNEVRVHAGTCL